MGCDQQTQSSTARLVSTQEVKNPSHPSRPRAPLDVCRRDRPARHPRRERLAPASKQLVAHGTATHIAPNPTRCLAQVHRQVSQP